MEGDQPHRNRKAGSRKISIHSLRMEGDGKFSSKSGRGQLFQSTPSAWRETLLSTTIFPHNLFQSTPSAWRETDFVRANCCHNIISIHSLRMEGDIYRMLRIQNKIISIHSLRMEGDAVYFADPVAIEEFQSTPSAWRETQARPARSCQALHFNPLPPHGGRLVKHFFCFCGLNISIHSLRMEGD